jgi:hypothetical protein
MEVTGSLSIAESANDGYAVTDDIVKLSLQKSSCCWVKRTFVECAPNTKEEQVFNDTNREREVAS